MNDLLLTIRKNIPLTDTVCKMTLCGMFPEAPHAGQFVNLRLSGHYLRRPISVCDYDDGELTILYKVVGEGTAQMRGMKPGEKLSVLMPLGNGYDTAPAGETPLLLGGGVGVPPLYLLAKELLKLGKRPSAVLGFNTKTEVFYEKEFRALGIGVTVATADGSYGEKGFVTDVLPENYSYFYTCGPEPMLKAVFASSGTGGQFSFEERMGCGFGACMGCSCRTVTGYKRICKDGPVLYKEEILWEK